MREALRGRRRHFRLVLADGIREDERVREVTALARTAAIPVATMPRETLDLMVGPVNHQGILLETSRYPWSDLDAQLAEPKPVLMLDHLQDPQNVGTLLRAAEAAGIGGVILARDRAAEITPAVVNASAGAVEHLRIAQVTNLTQAARQLKDAGWWVAVLDDTPSAQPLFEATIPDPTLLVVGAEGAGVSPGLAKEADLVLKIPMVGKVSSLNAATAGSIAIYELVRRSRSAAGSVAT